MPSVTTRLRKYECVSSEVTRTIVYLREALLTFVHGFELEFLLLLLLRIIIDFCEGTMDPRHSALSTGSLKS